MISRLLAPLLMLLGLLALPISAQEDPAEVVWVQIEAHPNLSVARDRAQVFADRLADVNGFSLGGSWYGIVLGPYTRADAEQVLRVYRREGQIPRDSFIARTDALGAQYWPDGTDVLSRGVIAPAQPETGVAPETAEAETAAAPASAASEAAAPAETAQPALPVLPDETPAEARRSEQLLSADDRRALQTALKAEGFYAAAIDGAFGSGTRRSMADWQAAKGFDPTGILTTSQRGLLIDAYNAPLTSVGMAELRDDTAGIVLPMPLGEVAFARYVPPLAHYDATGDLGVRVMLISQEGDQSTLFGLYDILQTLDLVPLNGPRERRSDSFTIEGRGKGIVSHTEATLKNGRIKGFMLIWPEGDEPRRGRVLAAMQDGFTRLDDVLPAHAGDGSLQGVDLVSGLEVRKPRLARSGFYVDGRGSILTTLEAVQGCGRITLDQSGLTASVAAADAALGVAVLKPKSALAPMAVARLASDAPRLNTTVVASGYSYEGVLGAPSLTRGTLADLKGLNGEPGLARLVLEQTPGDAGAPVMDPSGAVLGLLLAHPGGARSLPADVSLAATPAALRPLLTEAGIQVAETQTAGAMALSPNALAELSRGMTVLVNCWD